MGRHLTSGQALTYCECPRKYYYRYVERVRPELDQENIMDMLTLRGWVAFFKNERKVLDNVIEVKDLDGAYSSLSDMSVATAISKTSSRIGDMDFRDIERHLRRSLKGLTQVRVDRALAHIGQYGIYGEELGMIAYPPEDVERRIVDFKHRISGTVTLIDRTGDFPMPTQLSLTVPLLDGSSEIGSEMVAKFNALLTSEETNRNVPLSSIYFLKLGQRSYFPIGESNKEDIKAFTENVMSAESYPKNKNGCQRCEFKEVCKNDNGN